MILIRVDARGVSIVGEEDNKFAFVEGEVFAEVAKNPENPFIIASGDVDVKVLGTTFNFKA